MYKDKSISYCIRMCGTLGPIIYFSSIYSANYRLPSGEKILFLNVVGYPAYIVNGNY